MCSTLFASLLRLTMPIALQRSHMDNIVLGGIEVGADQFEERTVGDNTQMSQMEAAGPPAARALVVGSSPQQHQQRPGVASQRHQGASDAFGKTGAAALGSQEVHGRFETANVSACVHCMHGLL